MLKHTVKATLLESTSRPYDIDGNTGVSHYARFLVNNEIIRLRTDEDGVQYLQNLLKYELQTNDKEYAEGDLVFTIKFPKENARFELSSFTAEGQE